MRVAELGTVEAEELSLSGELRVKGGGDESGGETPSKVLWACFSCDSTAAVH